MRALLALAALAPALALMKPPTNPDLDDAKQLLGNAGKFGPKESSHDARRPRRPPGEDQEGRAIRATQARVPVATEGPFPINGRSERKYEALDCAYEDGLPGSVVQNATRPTTRRTTSPSTRGRRSPTSTSCANGGRTTKRPNSRTGY